MTRAPRCTFAVIDPYLFSVIPPGDPLPVDDRTPPTVIVVDDDDLFALWLTDLLRAEGCVVEREPDGLSALARLRRRPMPDLLMLDLMMPEMDGFQFLERLRDDPTPIDVPVVVLTAKDLTAEERAYLAERTVLVLGKSAQPITSLGTALAAIATQRSKAEKAAAPVS